MSAVVWTLARSGASEVRTLEGWGMSDAVAKVVSLGLDTLALSFGRRDLLSASPFFVDETLILLRDGAPFFRGRITDEQSGAYGQSEATRLTVSGPWWYLQNLIYSQSAKFWNGGPAVLVQAPGQAVGVMMEQWPTVPKQTSDIILNQSANMAGVIQRIATEEMITLALQYAIAHGAPIAIGTIDPGISMPREELHDVTCAEVILKSLRWLPGFSAFWDYSVDPPAFNVRAPANRSLYTIDIADGAVAEIELNQLHALRRAGVTINYLRRNQSLSGFELITLVQDQAGADPEGVTALVITIELTGFYYVQLAPAQTGPPAVEAINALVPEEPAPIGIAGFLYAAYATAPFAGRVVLALDDLPAVAWLAQRVSVLNGNPQWAAATMDIQQVTQSIMKNRLEITVGPPQQLGPSDLVALVRRGRIPPPSPLSLASRDGPVPATVPGLPNPRITFGRPPTPPAPPEPPHQDLLPSAYASPRTSYSGAYTTLREYDCGQSGEPACQALGTPIPYGDEPAYNSVAINGTSFDGALGVGAQRTYSVRGGGGFHGAEYKTGSGHFSTWTFDLTGFDPRTTAALKLIGTKTLSKADGTSETTPVSLDLPVGGVVELTARATVGVEHFNPYVTAWSKSGSIAYPTLRRYLVTS